MRIIPNRHIAFIFPAFVTQYSGDETELLSMCGVDFSSYLERASLAIPSDLTHFQVSGQNFTEDPLLNQYMAYIFSCAVSDILVKKTIVPEYVTYYSMGIYAALYHCSFISFEEGLKLIHQAYQAIESFNTIKPSGMLALGGLNIEDTENIIRSCSDECYIINRNSANSFLISGNADELEKISRKAVEEGALLVRMLSVQHPYHHPALYEAAKAFGNQISLVKKTLNNTSALISPADCSILNDYESIRPALIKNLYCAFDWQQTFGYLLTQQVHTFYECGAGDSLFRISKFIEGRFDVITLKKMSRLK